MTFLHKYAFMALGVNMFLASFSFQWSVFTDEFWVRVMKGDWHEKIELTIPKLVEGDFAAAAVLITFGALLGKTSPLQMLFIAFCELIFYSLNLAVGLKEYQAVDMGGASTHSRSHILLDN
jgi:ammonium transporter Rh